MESTCWTVIEGAAAGNAEDRDHFARRYFPVVRAYLTERWRTSVCLRELEDAVQEVFVECFRQGGMLERVDSNRAGGFRAYLYGLVRNVARRIETAQTRRRGLQPPSDFDWEKIEEADSDLERVFDKAWAAAILQEAAQRQLKRARDKGETAVKRVELLHLRFHEGLRIREIADLWNVEASVLHHDYARARQEFKEALREVLSFHHPEAPVDVDEALADLLT